MSNDQPDQTANFVVTTSDVPQVAPSATPTAAPEAQATKTEEAPHESEHSAALEPDAAPEKKPEPEPEQDNDEQDASASDELHKPRRSAQKRINKEVKRRAQAEAKAAELAKTVQELESKLSQLSKPAPSEDDFEDYDDYLKAAEDHISARDRLSKEAKALKQAHDAQESQSKALPAHEEAEIKLATDLIYDQIDSAKNLPSDFEQKVIKDASLPISKDMLKALSQTDDAPTVMYYLAENRAKAEEIANMEPAEQFAAIIRLDTRLGMKRETAKPIKIPKAPDPIAPVGTSSTQKPLSSMSFAEYEAHMNEQTKGRRPF